MVKFKVYYAKMEQGKMSTHEESSGKDADLNVLEDQKPESFTCNQAYLNPAKNIPAKDQTLLDKQHTTCPHHGPILQLQFDKNDTSSDGLQRFLDTPAVQGPLCLTEDIRVGHSASGDCVCGNLLRKSSQEHLRSRVMAFDADVDSIKKKASSTGKL